MCLFLSSLRLFIIYYQLFSKNYISKNKLAPLLFELNARKYNVESIKTLWTYLGFNHLVELFFSINLIFKRLLSYLIEYFFISKIID